MQSRVCAMPLEPKCWSMRKQQFVLVAPWAFAKCLKDIFDRLNASVAEGDPIKEASLKAYNTDLQRDYATTVRQRAENRGLNTRPHRQRLSGRRNHFVSAPKVL